MITKKRGRGEVKRVVQSRFFELIKRLLDDGLNWTDVAKYIDRYHDFEIRPEQLKVCFGKIQALKLVSMGPCGTGKSNTQTAIGTGVSVSRKAYRLTPL